MFLVLRLLQRGITELSLVIVDDFLKNVIPIWLFAFFCDNVIEITYTFSDVFKEVALALRVLPQRKAN